MITTVDPATLDPAGAPPCVVSIGVFDGVHLGHQAILAANVARARALAARPTVVTFRQHPKELLLGHAPRTLTTLEHRLELFRRAGIGHTVALTFDAALRACPAEEFVRELLARRLVARAFVLGFDSKFGKDRAGGPALLERLGFEVEVVPKVVVDQRAVSSTAIREAVELGDLAGAARMLGRRVSVFGEVVVGRRIGRTIGFPTANLDLHHELHPPTGVYACIAHLDGSAEGLFAVANIGFRPTLGEDNASAPIVEVHLLDFEGELYGRRVEVEFVTTLRGERRFSGIEELREQITRDIATARSVLEAELRPHI